MAEKNSLWKNIRKKAEQNRRTGATPKKPTAEMLRQERKIKAKQYPNGGDILSSNTGSYYSPVSDTVYLDPNDNPSALGHELYHKQQHVEGRDRLPDYYDGPLRQPQTPTIDELAVNYYNRNMIDHDILNNQFLYNNPSFNFIPQDVVSDYYTDPAAYRQPWTLEGEARLSETPEGRAYLESKGIGVKQKADGGPVNTLEGDLISKVIMNRNRGKDFVQRAYAVGEYPESNMFMQPDANEFGQKNSHLMGWGEDKSGQAYMYPEVMNPNNEAIKVPNQYADYISSTGYKKATGMIKAQGGYVDGDDDKNKKNKTRVYTDPREFKKAKKAYNDSLSLYNVSNNKLKEYKDFDFGEDFEFKKYENAPEMVRGDDPLMDYWNGKNGIKPFQIAYDTNHFSKVKGAPVMPIFKKPEVKPILGKSSIDKLPYKSYTSSTEKPGIVGNVENISPSKINIDNFYEGQYEKYRRSPYEDSMYRVWVPGQQMQIVPEEQFKKLNDQYALKDLNQKSNGGYMYPDGGPTTSSNSPSNFDRSSKTTYDYFKKWYEGRAKNPKFTDVANSRLNLLNSGQYPETNILPYDQMTTEGLYTPSKNTIDYSDTDLNNKYYGDINTLMTHENDHWLSNKAPQEFLNISSGFSKDFKNNKGWLSGKDALTQDEEIRARLSVWRQLNNIDPTKNYSPKELRSIINKNLNDENLDSNVKDIYELIKGDAEKLKYLNDSFVSNNSKNNNMQYAADGGPIDDNRSKNYYRRNSAEYKDYLVRLRLNQFSKLPYYQKEYLLRQPVEFYDVFSDPDKLGTISDDEWNNLINVKVSNYSAPPLDDNGNFPYYTEDPITGEYGSPITYNYTTKIPEHQYGETANWSEYPYDDLDNPWNYNNLFKKYKPSKYHNQTAWEAEPLTNTYATTNLPKAPWKKNFTKEIEDDTNLIELQKYYPNLTKEELLDMVTYRRNRPGYITNRLDRSGDWKYEHTDVEKYGIDKEHDINWHLKRGEYYPESIANDPDQYTYPTPYWDEPSIKLEALPELEYLQPKTFKGFESKEESLKLNPIEMPFSPSKVLIREMGNLDKNRKKGEKGLPELYMDDKKGWRPIEWNDYEMYKQKYPGANTPEGWIRHDQKATGGYMYPEGGDINPGKQKAVASTTDVSVRALPEGLFEQIKLNPPARQPQTISVVDKRKQNPITKKPINPNRDLVGGQFEDTVPIDIITSAYKHGVDPATALSIGLLESRMGTTDPNVGHIMIDPYSDYMPGAEDMVLMMKEKQDYAKKLGYTDPLLQLQAYNGLGVLSNKRGEIGKSAYGLPIPKEGIDLRKNPLYGKKVKNVRDSVIMQSPDLVRLMDYYKPKMNGGYMYYGGGPMQYEVGGKVWKNIAAGLYGAGEGILDTITMGATDQLTDRGFEYLTKVGNKNLDLNDPDDVKFLKTQQQVKGYSNAAGAIGTAVVTGNVQGAIGQGTKGLNTAFQASDWASDDFKKWSQGVSGVAGVAAGFAGGLNSDSFNAAAKAGTGIAGFGQKAGKIGSFGNQVTGMFGGNQQPLWQQGEQRQELLNSPDYLAMKEQQNQAYVNQGLSFASHGGNINNNSLNLQNSMRGKYNSYKNRYSKGGTFQKFGINEIPDSAGLHHQNAYGGVPIGPNAMAEGGEFVLDGNYVVSDQVDGMNNQTDEFGRTMAENLKRDLSKYTMRDLNSKNRDSLRRPMDPLAEQTINQIKQKAMMETEMARAEAQAKEQERQAMVEGALQYAAAGGKLNKDITKIVEEEYAAAYGGQINPKKYKGLNMPGYSKGGKLPKEVLRARVESHMSPQEADAYVNQYGEGGGIHIKESKKGTFTAAATKHGKSVQEFARQVLANKENYSSAMVKKANFARNAASWKHAQGGPVVSNVNQDFDLYAQNRGGMMMAEGGNMYAMGGPDGIPGFDLSPNEYNMMIDQYQNTLPVMDPVELAMNRENQRFDINKILPDLQKYNRPNLPSIERLQPKRYQIPTDNTNPMIDNQPMTESQAKLSGWTPENPWGNQLLPSEPEQIPGPYNPSGQYGFYGKDSKGNDVSINPNMVNEYEQGWKPKGPSNIKTAKSNQPNEGLTGLDYASMGMQALGPLSQLYYGLKGPDDVNYERIKADKIDPYRAITLANEESRRAQDTAGYNLRQNAPTSGSYMANMRALGLGAGKQRGAQTAATQYQADVANTQMQNQVNAQNAQISMQEQIDRLQEKDAARTNVTEGLSGMGSSTANMIRDYRTNQVNQTIANNIGTNNFKLDTANKTITYRGDDGKTYTIPLESVLPNNYKEQSNTPQFQRDFGESLNRGFRNRFSGPNAGK